MKKVNDVRRSHCSISVLLLLGLMSASPATQSQSAPQSVVAQICIAIRAEDKKALERLFIMTAGDTEAEAWFPVLLDSAIARQRLHRVSLEKFGVTLPATDDVGGNIFVSEK